MADLWRSKKVNLEKKVTWNVKYVDAEKEGSFISQVKITNFLFYFFKTILNSFKQECDINNFLLEQSTLAALWRTYWKLNYNVWKKANKYYIAKLQAKISGNVDQGGWYLKNRNQQLNVKTRIKSFQELEIVRFSILNKGKTSQKSFRTLSCYLDEGGFH